MEQPTPQVLPSPQVQQPAPQAKSDVGTVEQARSHSGDASWLSNIGFDVTVALILALAFIVVRRAVLDPFGGRERGVERDDAA